MIGAKIQAAFNEQIAAEHFSAYLYDAMAHYCESRNFHGFRLWLTVQAEEEREHAEKLCKHLHDRGGTVKLEALGAPPSDYKSMDDVFTRIVDHERGITQRIHDLYALALQEKDYAAQVLLHWFISEQVEEEATATEFLEIIRFVGEKSSGIFYLDGRAGKRARR